MARWQFRPPVERYRSGFRINLDDEERALVLRLLGELRDLLTGPDDHPALARIFPTAYHRPEDLDLDGEYQRLMREELVASRLTGIEIVVRAFDAKPPLAAEQLHAFMQAVNGIRLVLGTVLDVGDDHDPDLVDDDDPQVGEHHLYGFLSWLLEWTVRALQGT
jgi:hypothetical protein